MKFGMGLFGKTTNNSPKDKVQEWIKKLRKELMSIDRQIRSIQREEAKTRQVIKETAKQGDEASCRLMAKELVNSKKTINRLITSKAHINSVIMVMNTQLANLKITGSLAKSSDIMKSMKGLISIPELSQEMRQMSKELVKAGLMEEMISENLDSLLDNNTGELNNEDTKVYEELLFDITGGKIGTKPDLNNNKTSEKGTQEGQKPTETVIVTTKETVINEDADSIKEMERRLEALRS